MYHAAVPFVFPLNLNIALLLEIYIYKLNKEWGQSFDFFEKKK